MSTNSSQHDWPGLLLLDDDPAFLRVQSRLLGRAGYAVWPASNLSEARSAVKQVSPEYAVIDIHLGDENGLDFLRELRTISPNTVSVILSGYVDIPSAVAAVKLGAVDCLAKPVDPAELDACLKAGGRSLPETILAPSAAKTRHILAHWEKNDRNTTRAAEVLGMHRRSLQRILIRAGFGRERTHFEEKPSSWIKLRRLYSVWSGAGENRPGLNGPMGNGS
ncbi:MAG: response regulator [Pseudomonadota bacterium]